MVKRFFESQNKPACLHEKKFCPFRDEQQATTVIDGYRLPGIIDTHFHGAFGWDFVFGNPAKLDEMMSKVAASGITGLFPTLITCSEEQRLQALADIARLHKTRKALPIIHGIYLEGPFLAPSKRGSHPEDCLLKPSIALLEKWQKAADGLIKIITVAPELPGAMEFITMATSMGITVSLGHSAADWQTTEKAISCGARHVTHLFNAMPAIHHREAGMLSSILTRQNLNVELIGDCEHVAPEIISMIYRLYDNRRLLLVSDSVAPSGLPDGEYNFYNNNLTSRNCRCCLPGGSLFGGCTLLADCLKRLQKETSLSRAVLEDSVWQTPCNALKIPLPDTEVFFDTRMNWLASRFEQTWYHGESTDNA